MTENNLVDPHIHLHTHEMLSGLCLRAQKGPNLKIFLGLLFGSLLVVGIIGALYSQW